jgi:predicted HNH restriction endonuclease
MPIDRQRYPSNWSEIAFSIKEAASWRCRHCGKQCLRPGEKPKNLTKSERTIATLTVHHANFTPEDNRPENLIALCAPCHLAVHQTGKGNVSPGQLCLFSFLYDDNATLIIVRNIQLFSLTSS